MALQDVRGVNVSGDIQGLLDQVDEALAKLNERRPFSPEVEGKIRTTFLPDRVTATLNIEGIHVTRRQTLSVMDAMAIDSSPSRDLTEIRNVLMADELAYETAQAQDLISAGFVRSLNELVLRDLSAMAGQYRTSDVRITGASFEPPSHLDVPHLMQGLIDEFPSGDYVHPVLQAAWLHNQFTYIHPFVDGNGRAARLLQDYALIRRKMYPVGVASHKRDDYYAALQLADSGEWDDLVELIALAQESVVSKIDAITLEPEQRKAWVNRLATAAAAKKAGALHKQFLVWQERMSRIQNSFLTAAGEIEGSSGEIGVSFRQFDPIDFEKWKRIGAFGSQDKTWAFSMIFFMGGAPFFKIIAFYKRHKVEGGDHVTAADGVVSLAFTGQNAKSEEKPNFSNFRDEHISLRELLYVNDEMFCYRWNDAEKSIEGSECSSLEGTVQQFFEEAFFKKGGLGL